MKVLAAPAAYEVSDTRGTEPSVSYYILSLLAKYFGVNYCAIVAFSNIVNPLPENVFLIEVGESLRKFLTLSRLSFMLKYSNTAFNMLKQQKFDLIHHILPSGSLINPVAIRTDEPFVIGPVLPPQTVSFADDVTFLGGSKLEYYASRLISDNVLTRWVLEDLRIRTLERADAVIVVNNYVKEVIRSCVPESRIEVIPLGVDLNEFKYSPPPRNYNILMAGYHTWRKGFIYMIKAMPKILREFPEAKLHITGDGPQRKSLESLTRRMRLEKNIIFHGFVPRSEMPELMKLSRVLVLPSLSEAFGHVLTEAMAVGRPVVVTATAGPKEIVNDGVDGFLVPPADSDALADAVIKLFSDYELTVKMGLNARRKMELKFDWMNVAKQYYEVYEEVSR